MEDQQKFIIPLNRETEKIFYTSNGSNLRLIIDAKVLTEPRVFIVSKINRISPNGLVRVTLAESLFDPRRDYIEHDEEGNVIGMWASWFDYDVEPDKPDHPETNITCEISYRGVQNNQFRIKGNPRIFDVKFFRDDQQIEYQGGTWSFIMDGKPCDDLFTIEHHENDADKIKFIGSDDYKGQTVTLTFTSINNVSDSIEMNIVGN